MAGFSVPRQGDVYSIDLELTSVQEKEDRHRFVVITPEEINSLGISVVVPITTAGVYVQKMGLVVPVKSNHTVGVVVCNQVRSFDIQTRVRMNRARYVGSLDQDLVFEIVSRVLSVIEPANV